jgi:transposase
MYKNGLFWLNDAQWGKLESFLSFCRKGAHRVDDRRVMSGIFMSFKKLRHGVQHRKNMIRQNTI